MGVVSWSRGGRRERPPLRQLLRLPVTLLGNPKALWRSARLFGAWARYRPKEPHWYVGPVAVDPDVQGRRMGIRLIEAFCALADEAAAAAYLETDEPENVRFYERCGFAVTARVRACGTTIWFMRRPARTANPRVRYGGRVKTDVPTVASRLTADTPRFSRNPYNTNSA